MDGIQKPMAREAFKIEYDINELLNIRNHKIIKINREADSLTLCHSGLKLFRSKINYYKEDNF